MILSLFFKITSLLFLNKSIDKNQTFIKFILAVFLFGNLLFLASYAYLQQIFGEDIAEAIVFHFVFGVKGFGYEEYILPSILFISFLSVCVMPS